MPHRDEFSRWLEDPMTKMVFRALEEAEQAQKQQWEAASWGGSLARADDLRDLLLELRVRTDAYRALREMTFADVQTWLGIEDDK